MEAASLHYLAGLMDGEGSFCFQVQIKPSSSGRKAVLITPRVAMHLKYGGEVLYEFERVFGGKVRCKAGGYMQWDCVRLDTCKVVAETLLPYLRIKKRIATRFLEALAHFPGRRRRANGARTWSVDQVLGVAEIAYTLNPKTARKNREDVQGKLTKLREVYQELQEVPIGVGGPPKGSKRIRDISGKYHWEAPNA